MRRYLGEPLDNRCRIAVVSNDALGNYVATTPLLQLLRAQYPLATLDYFGGTRTSELWSREDLLSSGTALFGTDPRMALIACAEPYDLIVNVEDSMWARCFAALACGANSYVVGPCLASDGRSELEFANDLVGDLAGNTAWIDAHLSSRYPFLETGFIGEIFCRLAYLDGQIPRYRVPVDHPGIAIPDVLIATAASIKSKLWPLAKWRRILRMLEAQGLTVGLLGAKPDVQRQFWQGDETEESLVAEGLLSDMRGQLTLPQVVGAISKARCVLAIDNGVLHLACATSTPVVGLFRNGIHRLWAPPVECLRVMIPEQGHPVASISVEDVLEAVTCAIGDL